MSIHWIYLLLAAFAEALYGICVFHSRGWTLLWPSVGAVAAGIVTTVFLGLSMKGLPVGLAFVVWSGLAAIGAVLYGITALGEARDPMRLALIGMILAGIVGLKMTSAN